MTLESFQTKLNETPNQVEFLDTMEEIDFLTLPQIEQLLKATDNPRHRLQILLLS